MSTENNKELENLAEKTEQRTEQQSRGERDFFNGKNPVAMMVSTYYVTLGYVDEFDKDAFASQLTKPVGIGWLDKINKVIAAAGKNLVGALFLPYLVKFAESGLRSLQYKDELEQMTYEAKKEFLDQFLSSLK